MIKTRHPKYKDQKTTPSIAIIEVKWEDIMTAITQDGSGMKVILQVKDYDTSNPTYRVVYGDDDHNPMMPVCFESYLTNAVNRFNEYVLGEIQAYLGIEQ